MPPLAALAELGVEATPAVAPALLPKAPRAEPLLVALLSAFEDERDCDGATPLRLLSLTVERRRKFEAAEEDVTAASGAPLVVFAEGDCRPGVVATPLEPNVCADAEATSRGCALPLGAGLTPPDTAAGEAGSS